MDITIMTMLPERGETDYSRGETAGYRFLSIISVMPLQNIAGAVTAQRTGYIHVSGIDVRVSAAKFKNEFERPWLITNDDGTFTQIRKRAWRINATNISATALNNLLTNRQIVVTPAQLASNLQFEDNPPGVQYADFF